MTVYVDNYCATFDPKRSNRRKYIMSHMMADTPDELHAMADKIGVARKHYQGDHYDVCKSKRALAIRLGAIEVTTRDLVALRKKVRAA